MSQHSNRAAARAHVLGKMSGAHQGNSPGGAITQAPDGKWKVNDLNPATQARHPNGFGESDSREAALKHLRAIEYFKHHG